MPHNITYYTTYEIPCEKPCYAEYYNIAVCPIGCLTWNLIHVYDYPLRHVTRHIYIYSSLSNTVCNIIYSLEKCIVSGVYISRYPILLYSAIHPFLCLSISLSLSVSPSISPYKYIYMYIYIYICTER